MANLKTMMELARAIGAGNADGGASSTAGQSRITATAASASDGGDVDVTLDDGTTVTVPTLAPVAQGDEVILEVQNSKAVVVGSPGWGDAMNVAIEQNADDITAVITSVDGIETMIRAFQGGVLVGKAPTSGTTSVCALVNSDGSFDVVNVAWAHVDRAWEPQSYTVLSTQDDNGMAIYDGNGTAESNELARFGSDGFSLFGGLGKFTAETSTPAGFKRFKLELSRTSTQGKQASTRMRLDDNGGFYLWTRGFDDTAGVYSNGARITTRTNNQNVDGWEIHAAKNIIFSCFETDANYNRTFHPITINNHDLADFPTEYRVASLGEAIPNVSAKPSESARVLGWSYQKYASGLAHMWGVMPFNGDVRTERGSMYMSSADLCSAFPFDVSRILSFQFGQAFASDYTWGLTAWPHLSTAIWQAGNHWGINWRPMAPFAGSYGGYIPVDVWAYVE